MKRVRLIVNLAAAAMVAVVTLVTVTSRAHGQDLFSLMQQNMAFDQQMNGQLEQMMYQNQAAQQQLMQSVIQQHGPQLRAEYQQYVQMYGGNISFEQYVYYWILSAGGTDPAGGMQAMNQNFQGLQQAARTQQEGFDSYNAGWWDNTRAMDQAMERYSTAYRGNWYYQNPYTGEVHTQPYSYGPQSYSSPEGQVYIDSSGQHYLYNGGGWTPLNEIW